MPLLFIVQRLFEASTCANLQALSAREESAAVAVERKKSPTKTGFQNNQLNTKGGHRPMLLRNTRQ
jgi:hypothetical protein